MKKLGVGALALAIFAAGAAQKANATAVLIPYVKAGDGFVTAITYINRRVPDQPGEAPLVHFTYQLKSVTDYTAPCEHIDRAEPTTPNDVTTVLFDGNGPIDKPGLFGDTTGMGFTPIYQGEGFLVLENYDGVAGTRNPSDDPDFDDHNDLTAEAHIIYAPGRAVFSLRALEMHHAGVNEVYELAQGDPNNSNVLWMVPRTLPDTFTFSSNPYDYDTGNHTPQVTGVPFFPEDIATTSIFAIAVCNGWQCRDIALNLTGPVSLTAINYNVAMRLVFTRTPDPAGGQTVNELAGGYDRNENGVSFLSPDPFMCVVNMKIEDVAGLAWTAADLRNTGGWFNLAAVQLTVAQHGGWVARGIDFVNGDGVIPLKLEVSPAYGATATPLVPQIYAR